jgi:uncharacterized protein YktB (UPF0637 family)
VAGLRFSRADFEVFSVPGFSARLEKIHEIIRPRLMRLGAELGPELSRKMGVEFFPHVAGYPRQGIEGPGESWVAWGPSPKGYKRYAHLALCISGVGIHARAIVKAEALRRAEMGQRIKIEAGALEKSFRGTRIHRYEDWDCSIMPKSVRADAELFVAIGGELERKSAMLDVGFGWGVREAARLDREEVIDAFGELEPLYRILRSVG